jgi:hypothetical protein
MISNGRAARFGGAIAFVDASFSIEICIFLIFNSQ